jgi:hypothetical protein
MMRAFNERPFPDYFARIVEEITPIIFLKLIGIVLVESFFI